MKLAGDLSAGDLISARATLGYREARRKGSHIRLTTQQQGEHHVTIADHDALRIGTLSSILRDVAEHFGISREELARQLFGGSR